MNLKGYLDNPSIREALRRAAQRFAEGRERTIPELGNFSEVRRKTRTIKERALERADEIWLRVASRLVDDGVVFVEAVDAQDAREKILNILKEHEVSLLIKGKSITSEEVGLNPFLEANGVEVVETDLGERIIQLKGEKSSHLIVPAIHNSKEEVARLFSEYFGREIPPDPYVITKEVRKDLRRFFLTSKAGFTGANVVSEDPVAFYLMTNEGNGRLCATMPDIYITFTGYEKVVETLEDALWILRVLPRNSVGLRFSSYVSIFKRPFRWKDRKWYVVILDNGRRRALSDPKLSHALRCIRCGACMNVCPIYRVLSGLAFSRVYMGGIGAVWTAITEGIEEAYRVASLCTGCGSCNQVCPVEIPISELVEEVRSRAERPSLVERAAVKVMSNRNRVFASAAEMAKLVGIYDGESPFTAGSEGKGEVQLYVGCVIDQLLPEVARSALKLLDACGINVVWGREECCGLPARVYGGKAEYHRLRLFNLEKYAGMTLVFLCDSCLSTFIDYHSEDLRCLSLPELLIERGVTFKAKRPVKVCMHIPCHLKIHGREEHLIKLIGSIEGVELLRSPKERECCGGAGLYRYKLPEVSKAVFEEKVSMFYELEPEFVVTTCPSCLLQLRDNFKSFGVDAEVMHLSQFLSEYAVCASPSSASSAGTRKPTD